MNTVIIKECGGAYKVWVSRHRGTPDQAQRRAINKHFGRRASLWVDSGLGDSYGQIVVPCSTGGYSCETGRVEITVSPASPAS